MPEQTETSKPVRGREEKGWSRLHIEAVQQNIWLCIYPSEIFLGYFWGLTCPRLSKLYLCLTHLWLASRQSDLLVMFLTSSPWQTKNFPLKSWGEKCRHEFYFTLLQLVMVLFNYLDEVCSHVYVEVFSTLSCFTALQSLIYLHSMFRSAEMILCSLTQILFQGLSIL